MNKKIFWMVLVLFSLVLASSLVCALPEVIYVKINGDEHESGDSVVIERGEDLEIKVKIQGGTEDETNLQVEADLVGYEYSDYVDVSDTSHTFDLDAGDTEYVTLDITVPDNADADYYDLRVRVAGRTGEAFEGIYRLHIKGPRHSIAIRDIVLTPESVEAGRALLASVRIKNLGDRDEEGIRVTVSIPELGISDTDYVEELDEDESTSTEDLFLRIPNCAKEDTYTVRVTVEYDERYERTSRDTSIEVLEGDLCAGGSETQDPDMPETVITVGATSQDLIRGQGGAIYPITIANQGSSSKSYVISVDGVTTWASVRINPSNLITVGPGETKSVYVYITAQESAPAGMQNFALSVKSGDKTLKELLLKANVIEGTGSGSATSSWESVKTALVITLTVLIVLLVVLGLIIGFTKLRGANKGEDEPPSVDTYY